MNGDLIDLLPALLAAAVLLAFAGIPVFALLLQVTWPIRWCLHLVRARRAMREFDREYALYSLPGSPR